VEPPATKERFHMQEHMKITWCLSANGVGSLQKDQQTLHAWALSWEQRCSGNICNRNLVCGYASYIVTRRPIAKERLGKEAHNKYATNNRVDPFLGNAHNTRTQQ
jgi:hypothetical protein